MWYNQSKNKRFTGLRLTDVALHLLAARLMLLASHAQPCWRSPAEKQRASEAFVLILDYKLRVNQQQQNAINEALRTAQFVRNKCLRKWMGASLTTTTCKCIALSLPETTPLLPH